MKQILLPITLSIILFSACTKKDERPSVIYISGTVTDKTTSSPLDSVSIELIELRGSSIPRISTILKIYSTNSAGEFSFEFSQNKELYSYRVEISKEPYIREYVFIDKDLENQHFNIQLIK